MATAPQIAKQIVDATLDEDAAKLAAAWAQVGMWNGKSVGAALTAYGKDHPEDNAKMTMAMASKPALWDAIPVSILGNPVRAELQRANQEYVRDHPGLAVGRQLATAAGAGGLGPVPPRDIPNVARATAGVPPAYSGSPKSGVTVDRATAGVPPAYSGQPKTGLAISSSPIVVQAQAGIRSQSIDRDLYNALTLAGLTAGVSQVRVTSGGQTPLTAGGVKGVTNTGSTRHDRGFAADIELFGPDGRRLSFNNTADLQIIQTFVAAAAKAGATGFGAGVGGRYMGDGKIHVGYGPSGAKGGQISLWGGTKKNPGPVPDWLRVAAVQMPASVRLYAGGPLPVPGAMPSRVITPATMATGTLKPGVPNPTERPNLIGAQAAVADGGRLRKGDERDAVREVQKFLNTQGITDRQGQPLKEDGKLGRATEQAVREYQRSHPELKDDGVIGPRTLAAMVRDQEIQTRTDASRPGGVGSDFAASGGRGLPPTAASGYPGGVPAAAAAIMAYAGDRGAALANWLSGDAPVVSAGAPGLAQGFPAEPGSPLLGFVGPAVGDGVGLPNPYQYSAFGAPGLAQGFPAEPGSPLLGFVGPAVGAGVGLPPPDLTQWNSVPLAFENAFRPHDGPVDDLRLGGGGRLGNVGSGAEIDSVWGATAGAAAALNYREEQANMGNGFSDAFTGSAFAAALALGGGFSGLDANAFDNISGSRSMTVSDFMGGWSGSGARSMDGSDGWSYGGGGWGGEMASDAYQQITGSDPQTISDWTGGGGGGGWSGGGSGGGGGGGGLASDAYEQITGGSTGYASDYSYDYSSYQSSYTEYTGAAADSWSAYY